MHILIVYGTTEGHSAHLADYAAQALRGQGHDVMTAAAPAPAGFDGVLVAASLHAGHYQAAVVDYARAHREALAQRQAAFVSVSLSAAGHDHRDRDGLRGCVARFEMETGWMPTSVHHAAGAFAFSRYGFFTRLLMQRIARKRGLHLDPRRDYDLTDYEALRRYVCDYGAERLPAVAA